MPVLDGETLSHAVTVTIDSANIDSNLTDFDSSFDLSTLNDVFWNNVKSDGGDIRFSLSDMTTRLPVHVVAINTTTKTGRVATKSSVSSSVDTELVMWFGNAALTQPAVGDTYGRNNVYSRYYAVLLMNESGNGTSGEFVDVTGNGRSGQGGTGDSAQVPDQVSFLMDKGQDFVLANKDHIYLGTAYYFSSTSPFTMSIFANLDSVAALGVLFVKTDATGSSHCYQFYHTAGGVLTLYLPPVINTSSTTLSTGTDYHLGCSYDGNSGGANNRKIYVDGVSESFTGAFSPGSSSLSAMIGALPHASHFYPIDGRLQTYKTVAAVRSDADMKAESINIKTPLVYSEWEVLSTPNALFAFAGF